PRGWRRARGAGGAPRRDGTPRPAAVRQLAPVAWLGERAARRRRDRRAAERDACCRATRRRCSTRPARSGLSQPAPRRLALRASSLRATRGGRPSAPAPGARVDPPSHGRCSAGGPLCQRRPVRPCTVAILPGAVRGGQRTARGGGGGLALHLSPATRAGRLGCCPYRILPELDSGSRRPAQRWRRRRPCADRGWPGLPGPRGVCCCVCLRFVV
ncbi:hypothetical protein EMIHUDRAFT_438043, partial [Emiliania huxleyi CCMP1516]|uniref:Uncharacterized protein n=2 Tax=Emiliania huxleyi TaxID=2903 RepID=A0A0D3IEX6_EMIH1